MTAPKRLGYIAFWEGGFPVTDSNGDVILFSDMEAASALSSLSYRDIVKTYRVVRASKR